MTDGCSRLSGPRLSRKAQSARPARVTAPAHATSTSPRELSVYVHFPWCLQKCPYCDFLSVPAERPEIPQQRYTEAVLRELDRRVLELPDQVTLASVFFGGGTPSLWEPSELGRVLGAIVGRFGSDPDSGRNHGRVQPVEPRRGPRSRPGGRRRQSSEHRRAVARQGAARVPRTAPRRGGRPRRGQSRGERACRAFRRI